MSEAKNDDTLPAYKDILAFEDIIYTVKNSAQTTKYGNITKKFTLYP
jgi:hypothetical protein